MLFTKQMAMDNIRNRQGKRVFYLDNADTLTSEARDWLSTQRIEILPAYKARQEQMKLLTGGFVTEKPEHMTHLNGDVLVSKAHPRIAFRGQVDTLEAKLLLCGLRFPHLKEELGEILGLTRHIIRCDVLDETLTLHALCGMSQEEIRKQSHFPQKYFSVAHFMPDFGDTPVVLELNAVRCQARQAELSGLMAFSDREGNPTRTDILQALNRISSMLYILMLRQKAKT